MHSEKQGNGLILVFFILTAVAFGLYSVSDLIGTESRLNKKNEAYIEAKQAAESLIQNAIADMETRFEFSGALSEDVLSPTRNPLFISNDFLDFHNNDINNSNLIIPPITRYADETQFLTQDTEIIGGRVFFNAQVGAWAAEIFGKATVDHPVLGRTTVYASQILEFFSNSPYEYAIFYNLPMEIAPGPRMDVFKKVHVNGDMYVQSNDSLNFNGRVTVAGEVNYGRHPDSGMNTKDGAVNFTNAEGELINMKKNSDWPPEAYDAFSGTWLDSNAENFNTLAEQIWGGNFYSGDYGLLDQNNSVTNVNLPGLSEYREGTSTEGAFNSGYSIIQPALNEINIPSRESDPVGYEEAKNLEDAERNKFSYNAGLTIQVSEDGSLNYFTYERDSYDRVIYNDDGSPRRIDLTPSTDVASAEFFSRGADNSISGGLRDLRQEADMNLVNLDVAALYDLIPDEGDNEEDWGNEEERAPRRWWNGIVYVEFPQQNQNATRPDNVNPANRSDWGVKIVNGGRIPNPNFARDRDVPGTSIATNLPMYVQGNYNSDGDFGTGSPTDPDNDNSYNESGQETPSALAADAITFLSENWDDANSDQPLGSRVAEPTEVSAAILTGLVPSGKDGGESYSGGVENFPRFLENWKEVEFRMRGSIIAMFESEVATEPWGKSGVYSAPIRSWGFHSEYSGGRGPRIPKNDPILNARDLRLWSQQEYEARVRENWPGAGAPAADPDEDTL